MPIDVFYVYEKFRTKNNLNFSLLYSTLLVACKYDLTKKHIIPVWIFITFLRYKREMIGIAPTICLFFPMTHP